MVHDKLHLADSKKVFVPKALIVTRFDKRLLHSYLKNLKLEKNTVAHKLNKNILFLQLAVNRYFLV